MRATLKDDQEKADVIGGRLQAILKADELIIRSHEHPDLRGVLTSEFQPYQIEQRVEMHGQTLELPAKVARNMALVFHELTTNAVKHGSLSNARGRLRISWERKDGMVTVSWDEFDGPLISEPTTRGQGSRLIGAALAEVNGSVAKEFLATGLACRLCFDAGHSQGASDSVGAGLTTPRDAERPGAAALGPAAILYCSVPLEGSVRSRRALVAGLAPATSQNPSDSLSLRTMILWCIGGRTMRPKKHKATGSIDLFRARLDQIINMKHVHGKLDVANTGFEAPRCIGLVEGIYAEKHDRTAARDRR